MKSVAVDCTFSDDRVQVRRIKLGSRWQAVEQGRQWVDHEGRHVLVMVAGQQAQELLLRRETMGWIVRPAGRSSHRIV